MCFKQPVSNTSKADALICRPAEACKLSSVATRAAWEQKTCGDCFMKYTKWRRDRGSQTSVVLQKGVCQASMSLQVTACDCCNMRLMCLTSSPSHMAPTFTSGCHHLCGCIEVQHMLFCACMRACIVLMCYHQCMPSCSCNVYISDILSRYLGSVLIPHCWRRLCGSIVSLP